MWRRGAPRLFLAENIVRSHDGDGFITTVSSVQRGALEASTLAAVLEESLARFLELPRGAVVLQLAPWCVFDRHLPLCSCDAQYSSFQAGYDLPVSGPCCD